MEELTRAAALRPRPEVLGAHLQWPEHALQSPSALEAARRAAHLIGVCFSLRVHQRKVLWTAHNLQGHDSHHPRVEALMWRLLMPLVTDVHVMTEAGVPEVLRRHPSLGRARWHVIPHGDYPRGRPATSRQEAREQLGLPARGPIVMSMGLLRAYKGLDRLAEAFTAFPADGARLLMWGAAPDESAFQPLAVAAAADPRIDLRPGYVEEEDLDLALAASDLAVLPYRKVLNSGSALRSLSAGRPVLVPDTETFAELARRVGPGWVRRYSSELSLQALQRALAEPTPATGPDLSWCSWDVVGRGISAAWGAGKASCHSSACAGEGSDALSATERNA